MDDREFRSLSDHFTDTSQTRFGLLARREAGKVAWAPRLDVQILGIPVEIPESWIEAVRSAPTAQFPELLEVRFRESAAQEFLPVLDQVNHRLFEILSMMSSRVDHGHVTGNGCGCGKSDRCDAGQEKVPMMKASFLECMNHRFKCWLWDNCYAYELFCK